MLKVTVLNGGTECIRKVKARLSSPWVPEPALAWEEAQQAASGKKTVVDLSGMAFKDSNRKAILTNMIGQGRKKV